MPTETIHIIGAGGHAKVVVDALMATGVAREAIQLRAGQASADVLGGSVIAPEVSPELNNAPFHVAIGASPVRRRLFAAAEGAGGRPLTVRHPAAIVSSSAEIGDGSFTAAGAIVGPSAHIGRGAIINHGSVVDHDCRVGDFTHIAPGATLGGGVSVGHRCLIGANAAVLPGVSIGDDVVVGAGAVVTRDIGPDETWTGVPAGPRKPSE